MVVIGWSRQAEDERGKPAAGQFQFSKERRMGINQGCRTGNQTAVWQLEIPNKDFRHGLWGLKNRGLGPPSLGKAGMAAWLRFE